MSCALEGTPMENCSGGAGLGMGGGSIYMGLYAASSVYCGGPGTVTKEVVDATGVADPDRSVAASAVV